MTKDMQEALAPFKAILDEYPNAADDDYVTSSERLYFAQLRKLVAALSAPVADDGGALRETVQTALREHFEALGHSVVAISSDGIERVYYSGFSLQDLTSAVLAAVVVNPLPVYNIPQVD